MKMSLFSGMMVVLLVVCGLHLSTQTSVSGCYKCTERDEGCMTSDEKVLAKYKANCTDASQCLLRIGQKDSPLYKGEMKPMPADEGKWGASAT